MGGEREQLLDQPKSETTVKTEFANFRLHQNNGEVHFHDDSNKLKTAVPVSAWWKAWDRLRNEPGTWNWIDSVNLTKLTVETVIFDNVVNVYPSISKITIGSNWEKINTFTKR